MRNYLSFGRNWREGCYGLDVQGCTCSIVTEGLSRHNF